jgi:GH3 auxin-responsive promoter
MYFFNPTPIARFFLGHQLKKIANSDPIATQKEILLKLIQRNANTKFGVDNSFASINSVEEYQTCIKIRKYEDFWQEYWGETFPILENSTCIGRIPYFAVSSGTSLGPTKYLPINQESLNFNNLSGREVLGYHLLDNPNSKLFAGKALFLGGSTSLNDLGFGIVSGDLSGLQAINLPPWIKPFNLLDSETALIKDWEEKIVRIADLAIKADLRLISGVPSWLLVFFDYVFKKKGVGRISEVFPNLELIIHGGVNFTPYRPRFKDIIGTDPIQLREVYPASEGFIASADSGYEQGLRLNTNHGIFFEFIELDEIEHPSPRRYWLKDVRLNQDYSILLTTTSGLWSYVLGDTVRFVSLNPYRLIVTGRISYMLSAFGEHLIGSEIEDAVSTAAKELNISYTEFTVGAVYPKEAGELGKHLYLIESVELTNNKDLLKEIEKLIDKKLSVTNEDYSGHRSNGFGLGMPTVLACKQDFFSSWLKSRGKLGGQNKVPRVVNNQDLFRELLKFHNNFN